MRTRRLRLTSLALVLAAAALGGIAPGPVRAGGGTASILPEDRRMDWRPGVPGGIPAYPVFASAKAAQFGAKGDGTTDDTAAIQTAIDACPAGKAVHLPAGTYRLTATLSILRPVVLRGDGPARTRLVNEATQGHAISLCVFDQETVTRAPKGAAKGATRIDVEDASRFRPGDLLLVDQRNDPELVELTGEGGTCRWAGRENGGRAMGQLVQLVARDGSTLTLSRPLAMALDPARAPEVVRSTPRTIERAGVEDLYLETTQRRADDSSSIQLWNAVHCWVRNVESSRGWSYGHVTLKRSLGCEVRDSFFHHAHAYGSGHGYGVLVTAQSTDSLVENNLCYHLNSGLQVACSGPGNVFGYNLAFRTFGRDYPDTDWAHADLCQHAAHPFMTLFEGNHAGTVCFDFYWGSSSHNVLFRNSIDLRTERTDGRPMSRNVVALRLDARNRFVSALGNVLGHEGMKGDLDGGTTSGFTQPAIWSLGHPSDPQVLATLLRHGNFDHLTRRTSWDPAIRERDLPDSLYLDRKPAFFGKLAWPPIGPDRKPMAGTTPARERFLAFPAAERAAQDLLYLGDFQRAAGKADAARAAYREVLAKYGSTASAPAANAGLAALE